MAKRQEGLLKNNDGGPGAEMAIVLPLLLLIIMVIAEFGMFFVQKQIAGSAISSTARDIELNPLADLANKLDAYDRGTSFMNLNPDTGKPNYICAQAFAYNAKPTKPTGKGTYCQNSAWDTANPNPSSALDQPYYIGISVYAKKNLFTPISNFLPDIYENYLITVRKPFESTPSGSVMPFDRTDCARGSGLANCSCPTGWTKYINAQGKQIVGMGNDIPVAATYTGYPVLANTVNLAKGATDYNNPYYSSARRSVDRRLKLSGSMMYQQLRFEVGRHTHLLTEGLETSTEGRDKTPGGDVEFRGNQGIIATWNSGGRFMNIMDPFVALLYCKKCADSENCP